jgi:hypothetical protein
MLLDGLALVSMYIVILLLLVLTDEQEGDLDRKDAGFSGWTANTLCERRR